MIWLCGMLIMSRFVEITGDICIEYWWPTNNYYAEPWTNMNISAFSLPLNQVYRNSGAFYQKQVNNNCYEKAKIR